VYNFLVQILIFHNPNSGKRKSQTHADKIERAIKRFQSDAIVKQFAAVSIQILNEFWGSPLARIGFDAVIIIGGDGTVGPVVNAMKQNGLDIPIYCFGRGTANDFAGYLKTNTKHKRAAKTVLAGEFWLVDTLHVNNETYACNNAAGGAFTTGVTKYNKKLKMLLGKPAYILTAFFKAFTLKSQLLRFTVDGKVFEADIFLFYILNTKNVGGVKNASPLGDIHDGLLDLVCIKRAGFFGKISMAAAKIFGRFHKSKHVIHIQGKEFLVEIVQGRPVMPNFTNFLRSIFSSMNFMIFFMFTLLPIFPIF
jgi:YegS/Rv2252/BmrU family lipid kinase